MATSMGMIMIMPIVATIAVTTPKITATAHKLGRIVYNLMRYGWAYVQQTEATYAEQVKQRLEKQLRRRARELGYELKKLETPPPVTVQG